MGFDIKLEMSKCYSKSNYIAIAFRQIFKIRRLRLITIRVIGFFVFLSMIIIGFEFLDLNKVRISKFSTDNKIALTNGLEFSAKKFANGRQPKNTALDIISTIFNNDNIKRQIELVVNAYNIDHEEGMKAYNISNISFYNLIALYKKYTSMTRNELSEEEIKFIDIAMQDHDIDKLIKRLSGLKYSSENNTSSIVIGIISSGYLSLIIFVLSPALRTDKYIFAGKSIYTGIALQCFIVILIGVTYFIPDSIMLNWLYKNHLKYLFDTYVFYSQGFGCVYISFSYLVYSLTLLAQFKNNKVN